MFYQDGIDSLGNLPRCILEHGSRIRVHRTDFQRLYRDEIAKCCPVKIGGGYRVPDQKIAIFFFLGFFFRRGVFFPGLLGGPVWGHELVFFRRGFFAGYLAVPFGVMS